MIRTFAALALTLALAAPAAAQGFRNADVNVQFVNTGNVVEAYVTVVSTYGLRLQGTVDVLVGPDVFKLGPVNTSTNQVLVAPVAPSDAPFTGCAVFNGRAVSVGDAFTAASAEACNGFDPYLGVTRLGRRVPDSRAKPLPGDTRGVGLVPVGVAPRPVPVFTRR